MHISSSWLTIIFQFLWGWNVIQQLNHDMIAICTFNSFEDETLPQPNPNYPFTFLSIPLRMKLIQVGPGGPQVTIFLSIPLRMKPTRVGRVGYGASPAFNSFEDKTCNTTFYFISFCLSIPLRMKQIVSGLRVTLKIHFQFLWGWNAIPQNCSRGSAHIYFQFLWGWNLEDETISSKW